MQKRHIKFSSVGNILDPRKLFKTKRVIRRILIHCSATLTHHPVIGAKTMDLWHQQRWGSGLAYHYVVRQDGTLEKGRWVDFIGASAKDNNLDTIAICYSGGMKRNENGKLVPNMNALTNAQRDTLLKTVRTLQKMYDVEDKYVLGHNELANVAKACPCMTMDDFRADLRGN